MTDHTDIGRHTPTPDFRDALEARIVRAMRAPLAADAPPSTRIRRRPGLRTVALIALGMLLGVGTQLASAQVQEARQRTELERAKMAEREVAALRVRLAKMNEEAAQKAFATGAGSREEVVKAAAEVRAREVDVLRLEVDFQEIRATAAPPRDELWAPRTAERDFVRERLQITALVAQQALADNEAAAAEAERSARVGAVARSVQQEAALRAARARLEFQLLARKLQLRERFVKDRLTPEAITMELELGEVELGLQEVQQRVSTAMSRLATVRAMREAGTAQQIDVVRAELGALEVEAEHKRLLRKLAELRIKAGKPVTVQCGMTDC